jgi:hypothetical protein
MNRWILNDNHDRRRYFGVPRHNRFGVIRTVVGTIRTRRLA